MTTPFAHRNALTRGLVVTGLVVASMVWLVSARQAASSARFVSVDGNDAGPGTASAPWRTIQRCVRDALPGDVCAIGAGTFDERVSVTKSGTDVNPIRIMGRPDGSTVILGALAISGDHVTVDHVHISMADGVIRGLSLSGGFDIADTIEVSTTSEALGLNNVAAQLSGTSNTLRRSTLQGTCFGLWLFGTSNTVEQNEIVGMRRTGVRCGDVDYVRLFGSGHRISNNALHGIDMTKTGPAHVDCFQTFDNNGLKDALVDVVIEGNLCADAHQGLIFEAKFFLSSHDVMVRNNLFARIHAWCANVNNIGLVRFFNNTCDTSEALHGMWCRGNTGVASCEFKNNIFYGRGTAYGVMDAAHLIDGDNAAPGKDNLIFAPGRSVKGYAMDRVNEDPRFFNLDAGDYHLTPSSPARDAGLTIDGWSQPVDRDGIPRPQGSAWDIGAYEFVVARPAPPAALRLLPPGQ
jgi:hypothetical protein